MHYVLGRMLNNFTKGETKNESVQGASSISFCIPKYESNFMRAPHSRCNCHDHVQA